jgi:A/G-specific adenine glycosylase
MASRTNVASPAPATGELLSRVTEFRSALASWYQQHHRPLPWRTEPSLYRTVVSELMLQQTRIDTALPYFERWMEALPDFTALAAAPEEAVLKLWEGLGYYRRARNLHQLAQDLTRLSEIPRTPSEWQKFKGIGAYSSAAITSLAFGTHAACVDGNVVRVLSRLCGYRQPLKDSSSAARIFQPLADALLDPADPGQHNQAMMELGATACQRKAACGSCPVASFCQGNALGVQQVIPVFPARTMEKVEVARVWCTRGDELLLSRATRHARRLAHLCELPAAEELGLSVAELAEKGKLELKKQRSITRFTITESIYAVDFVPPAVLPDHLFWTRRADLDKLTFSGPHRRWISEILLRG